MKIVNFKTEYSINPLGLSSLRPRFTWEYGGENIEKQVSYRIIVSSTENGKGDLWDSKTVKSHETVNIEYEGIKLQSRQEAFVTLICKTGSKKTLIKTAKFEMGLLYDNGYYDWWGQYVGSSALCQGSSVYMRNEFTLLDKPVKKMRLYLIAIGYHELYINGKKVSNRVLAPSQTDYSVRIPYITYDITNYVKSGINSIGLEIGYGFAGRRNARFQLYGTYVDGEEFNHACCIGTTWIKGGATLLNSVYGGETFDNGFYEEFKGWNEPNFPSNEDNGWLYTTNEIERGVCIPDLIEPIIVKEVLKPVKINKISKNETVYTFPENVAGWCRIKVKGEAKSQIKINYSELLKNNRDLDTLNYRSAKSEDVFILSGKGIEEYAPKFTYHGFNYAKITVTGKAEILDVTAEVVYNDVEKVGEFSCSNETLNKLHKIAVRTETNNLHSIMTDCPQRDERFGWLNDLSSRIYQTVNNFDMAKMFDKISQDIMDEQMEGGEIGDTAPFKCGGMPADPVDISYLLLGDFSYKYYGNKRLIERQFKSYKKWLDFLIKNCKNSVYYKSGIGDWVIPKPYINERIPNDYIATCYIVWYIRLIIKFAKILGLDKEATKYLKLEKRFINSVINNYYDKKTCNFSNGSQSANAIALSLNLVPKEDIEKVKKNLINDIVNKNYHSSCGNQGYRHLFSVLGDNGYIDDIIKILTNPEYPGWGYMLNNGATTVWERWEKEVTTSMHSFNHPMFSAYDMIFYKYLGGIRISEDAYAFNKVTINPLIPKDVDFVNCSFKTIRGKIQSNWKKIDNKVEFSIKIPYGIQAEFVYKDVVKPLFYGEYKFTI